MINPISDFCSEANGRLINWAFTLWEEKVHSLLSKQTWLGSEALLSFREKTDLTEGKKAVISRLG